MTIEERAMNYANNNPHGNPYNWNAHHDAYVDGANDQKAIDDKELQSYVEMTAKEAKQVTIDKVCEWLEEYTTRIRKTNIGNGVCEFQFMHPLQVTEMLTELRKAMGE